MSITENVRAARRKINAAAESAGRSGSEVRLLAATKMNGPEAVQEAIRAGVDICAENRVQEFLSKNAVNAYGPCCVQCIGHLQKIQHHQADRTDNGRIKQLSRNKAAEHLIALF